ncbi:hypothetical protein [Halobacillus sp. Marseille-Q1614]|uniref:hypothetical protein n=1 Tax=Halobacillus sp. Marseille-Q1614 TaxID=2709134 RepID=UPI00156EC997|nr:hypothetical protein [Halobacillus sp. Marseille-Q1614]
MDKRKGKSNNANIEKRELHFHLHLRPSLKEDYIRIFNVLADNHTRMYKAVYERLETHTNEVADEFKEEALSGQNTSIPKYTDYGDYMEAVQDYVFERLDEQFLMHYQFELMSLSNLYQVFEQQIRQWLFEEMTHNENQSINQVKFYLENNKGEDVYGEFYSNFRKLTNLLRELKLTFTDLFGDEELIVETDIWKTIRECNLLSNTFKHGSGGAASNLYDLYPQYFEKVDETRLMDLYRTTNLERVLAVNKISFKKYCNSMKKFWEKMKEHQYGKVMGNVDISSE